MSILKDISDAAIAFVVAHKKLDEFEDSDEAEVMSDDNYYIRSAALEGRVEKARQTLITLVDSYKPKVEA